MNESVGYSRRFTTGGGVARVAIAASQIHQHKGGGGLHVGPAIVCDWLEVEGPPYEPKDTQDGVRSLIHAMAESSLFQKK